MLSQQASKPTPMDDRRQHHHQRQQSTPTVFEAHQAPFYPATQQVSGSHRRGMSLNQPHYLQEAQQHSQARPGQQQRQPQSLQLSEQEFRNLQHQQLDAQIDSLFSNNNNNNTHSFNNKDQHAVKIERSRSHPEAYSGMNLAASPVRSANGSPAQVFLDPQSVRGQEALVRRPIARSEAGDDAANDAPSRDNKQIRPQRPYTPPTQSSNNPLTPDTSPYPAFITAAVHSDAMKRSGSQNDASTIRPGRSPVIQAPPSSHALVQMTLSAGQMDPNATLKAPRRPAPLQGLSNDELWQAHHMVVSPEVLPSPPNTAPLQSPENLNVAFMSNDRVMEHFQMSFSPEGSEAFFDSAQSMHGSARTSPQMSLSYGSPDMQQQQYRGDMSSIVPLRPLSDRSSPTHTVASSIDFDLLDSPTRDALSPRAGSISDLNLDATIEETGISAEEVQAYISQPDPETGKWTCMYPECGKEFGRKENVRAHVQTHLGDRQFKCIHCGKCFVRQHDLKRHSKTHSGVKPYPCRCGNSFARHDALTRHRQRGICTGGFEGVVKKVAKRGRPRKERPNREDRLDKAARTRKRAAAKSYASSVSGTSDSSYPESPLFLSDGLELEASKAGALQSFNSQSFTLDPEMLNFSPPPSPYSTEGPQSPRKARSNASGRTPNSTSFDDDQTALIFQSMNVTDTNGTSAESNVGSQVGSPPELSHSSPPSSTRLMDFDFGTNFDSSGSVPSEGMMKHASHSTDFDSLSLHLASSPNDLFTSSWNENTFLNFDKDNNGVVSSMFSNSFDDDIMFSDNCETGGGFF